MQTPLGVDEVERLGRFVSSVTDYAIYMLSPDGHVASWNAGAQRIKGYAAAEIVGQHFSQFYTAEDQLDGLPMRALALARDGGKFEAEGWRVRKDGTQFRASVVIDPVRTDDGELLGFAKITRDITEQHIARIELESAREALYHSQKMEALGKVTGGVAHDFNNLLSVISNGLAALRRHPAPQTELRLLDAMEQALDRGVSLVLQLLAFAKQQPLERSPHDLSRLINSFEAVLRRAGSSSTVLQLRLQSDLPAVLVDATQFETALLNLVVNAYDATRGVGRIDVSTSVVMLEDKQVGELPMGRYVAACVKDDGQGMDLLTAQRAVEPFFTTKGPGKGTGLGLSQVFGMVQQCGGDLQIESALGAGARITMYFPALQDGTQPCEGSETETVLVVDDQPEVLDSTGALFQALGFEVLRADSAAHAMDVLSRAPRVSLLFTDVAMPGMNGLELARAAVQEMPSLRVILASGYAAVEGQVPANGRLAGFPFIAKPYKINDVLRKLRTLA